MTTKLPSRKNLQSPVGCEGYLTRRQAALVLGFASEFKIREFERKGMLHSVRGPMRAAFYPRPEVLALKAQLARGNPENAAESWSDAELLTLLGHPKPNGEFRTAYDLVLETQITIERALRVCDFWATCAPQAARATLPSSRNEPAAETTSVETIDTIDSTAPQERRRAERLSHDILIRDLRHPDPRVREHAFSKLKESRGF